MILGLGGVGVGSDAGNRAVGDCAIGTPAARRQEFVSTFVVHDGKAQLTGVVHALGATSSLAHTLNGWQQHADQNANDRNHDQQLDQGKAPTTIQTQTHEKILQKVSQNGPLTGLKCRFRGFYAVADAIPSAIKTGTTRAHE